jgi:LysM repeat protein/lysophospholipase L1-like esterase
MSKPFYLFLFILFLLQSYAQVVDTTLITTDSLETDLIPIDIPENTIKNPEALADFIKKLIDLKQYKRGKINIVHIGDSHIQADLMTGVTRKKLQEVFGNAGRGFVFPHALAKTNGSWDVRFTSTAYWDSYRNISPVNGTNVGISGIALSTRAANFGIELNVRDTSNFFNTIKIITPANDDSFGLAIDRKSVAVAKKISKKISHRVRNGEALSVIADKYNVSITAIKKANRLKSNTIKAGKTLKIPGTTMTNAFIDKTEYIPLPVSEEFDYHYYTSKDPLNKIFIIPNKVKTTYELSGVVLENANPGILYHNIGVNGAKLSDYNKYPVFFEQLKSLQPDLIIIALGTNESFDKLRSEDYMDRLDIFIKNAKDQNPGATILVITPPPSLFQRKYPNVFVADYAQKTLNLAQEGNFAVWDMFSQLGGLYGVSRNFKQGLMANDKVHYSKPGYEKQGNLLSEAILNMLQDYKKKKD